MKKKIIIAIVAAIPLLMVCSGCGNKNKQPTIEEQIARNKYIDKIMCNDSCKAKRDVVLKKYFGSNYTLAKSKINNYDSNYNWGYFMDDGVLDGTINGAKGKYEYHIDITVSIENPLDWTLTEFRVKDIKTQHYVYVIRNGSEENVEEYEKAITTSNSESDIYVSDEDLSAIEDALQREWNVSNAMSSVGAESSNVFKIKKESVSGNEVTVSYSLRSTYSGQKKFVDLHGVVKKNSDGSWSVVNLGY